MGVKGDREVGYSPPFLRAVARELELVARRIDTLDERIEKAKRPSAKQRISEQRAGLVAYERLLRRLLR